MNIKRPSALRVISLTCFAADARVCFESHLKAQLRFKCETKLSGNCSLTAALIPCWLFSYLSFGESCYLDRDGYYSAPPPPPPPHLAGHQQEGPLPNKPGFLKVLFFATVVGFGRSGS